MKVSVKNLGALRQAEFELGDMTIICGLNNTGKTYATYALFGFLAYWHEAFTVKVSPATVDGLLSNGSAHLDANDFLQRTDEILAEACKTYTQLLPTVFASAEKNFSTSDFRVTVEASDICPIDTFQRTMGAAKAQIFNITKAEGNPDITVSLLVEKDKIGIPPQVVGQVIGEAVKDIIFGNLFPNPFIASAERTGAAIFRKELNFARNRLLEEMNSMERELNPFELLNKVYSDYALPVRRNVDFTRQLEDCAKKESFISKDHPGLLDDFRDIIGGEYRVIRDELYFVPKAAPRLRLTMDESSSAVRSLLDIGFYLRHVAQPNDLLMVDEPELNLHPENQRRIARLFARLVNLGVRVFITTHSDYIIKELNTLIMLKQDQPHIQQIKDKAGYRDEELITAERIRVFVAKEARVLIDGHRHRTTVVTLVPADIRDDVGIEADSFDFTITQMNRIQKAIILEREL